jgi:sorting nexin-25
LCPSPDYFKNSEKANSGLSNQDSKLFSLSSIFKSSKSRDINDDEYLDQLFIDTDLKSLETNARDSIAEPFYFLIEELFELKGMKSIFRKSLIMFVQLTYGQTINRKIREFIYWILNDDMVAFYLGCIRDSFWKLNESSGDIELIKYEQSLRTQEDKQQTKKLARLKLISNIPG